MPCIPLRSRTCWAGIRLSRSSSFKPSLCGKSHLCHWCRGSIGSELCRQILQLEPAALVMLERSEPALYAIDQELAQRVPDDVKLLPVLGSASDQALVQDLFEREQVQVVVHAAALQTCSFGWRRILWRASPITFSPRGWFAKPHQPSALSGCC